MEAIFALFTLMIFFIIFLNVVKNIDIIYKVLLMFLCVYFPFWTEIT